MDTYRLIINADDFGLTNGVSRGIVEAIHYGCVTDTTAMAAVPGAAGRLARWAPEIPGRIGAHLQLTSGRPVLDPALVPSLVGPDGCFPASKKLLARALPHEIEMEWQAQLLLLKGVGIDITHLDTHHQVHRFANVFEAFVSVARQYGVPARPIDDGMAGALRAAGIPCVGRTLLDWYGGDLSEARLLTILKGGAAGCNMPCTLELMCHPGYICGDLPMLSKYVDDREAELRVLARPGIKTRLEAAGFVSWSYAQLSAAERSK